MSCCIDVDQMAILYSTKMSSCQGYFKFFYNMLDLAAMNSHIYYSKVKQNRWLLKKMIDQIPRTSENGTKIRAVDRNVGILSFF